MDGIPLFKVNWSLIQQILINVECIYYQTQQPTTIELLLYGSCCHMLDLM
jgi:hypothetical protein